MSEEAYTYESEESETEHDIPEDFARGYNPPDSDNYMITNTVNDQLETDLDTFMHHILVDSRDEREHKIDRFLRGAADGWRTTEWLLFSYYAINYYDEFSYRLVMDLKEDRALPVPADGANLLEELLSGSQFFNKLTDSTTPERATFNHVVFQECVQLKANNLAETILTNH